MKKIISFISFILLIQYCLCQQISSDRILIEKKLSIAENHNKPKKSEIHSFDIVSLLVLMYRANLSEQIAASCEFTPSCSSFSLMAINEFGFIKGVFLTTDRLMRCGSSASDNLLIFNYDANAKIIDYPNQYNFNK